MVTVWKEHEDETAWKKMEFARLWCSDMSTWTSLLGLHSGQTQQVQAQLLSKGARQKQAKAQFDMSNLYTL